MKNVKTFGQIFETTNYSEKLTPEQNAFINKLVRGSWKYNDRVDKVELNGYINHCDLSSTSGMKFKDPIDNFMGVKFSTCNGNCDLGGNDLESLEGTPDKVYGSFSCKNNGLETLIGGPKFVRGYYDCSGNELINLEGIADEIDGSLDVRKNPIKSLKGLVLRDVVWQVKGVIWIDGLMIPNGRFTRSFIRKKFISGTTREKSLLSTILDNNIDLEFMDAYFKQNPLELYTLDDQLEIKKGILKRTGIRDYGKIGSSLKNGLI